jgi:uncharacterized protein YdiU (UPF0061 family)
MEAYDPATVFSSIDRQGRYAYGNQPRIMLWNLTRLAETLLLVLEEEAGNKEAAVASAQESLEGFALRYEAAFLAEFRRKLGLMEERECDEALVHDLLERMAAGKADFTLTFRRLCDAAEGSSADAGVRRLFADPADWDAWAVRWRARLADESASAAERAAAMRRANPIYIPRNHLVEAALNAAAEWEDFGVFEELLGVVTRPFEERDGLEKFAMPAKPEEAVRWTFCGT